MTMVAVLCREGFSWKWKTVLVVLLSVAGVLTGARSFYYLAAGACALVVVLFTRSSGVRAILCCAVCIVGVSAIVVMVDRISDFEMSVSSASATPTGRELKTMLALQEFEEHPVIGIGTGRYVRAETNYYATVLLKGTTGTNPHILSSSAVREWSARFHPLCRLCWIVPLGVVEGSARNRRCPSSCCS